VPGPIGVGPTELREGSGKMSAAAATCNDMMTQLRGTNATFEETISQAQASASTAMSTWTGGQAMMAFQGASQRLQRDLTQFEDALASAIAVAPGIAATLNEMANALNTAANNFDSSDSAVASSFNAVQ
jgi:uncharacterized protein YukE